MDDLILKYFQENLTEAEEKALSERLLNSSEDALRFGQQAEAAYRHYGLPEPKWPGFLSASAGINLKLWVCIGAGLTGIALWGLWRHFAESVPAVPQSLVASSPVKISNLRSQKTEYQPGLQASKEDSKARQGEKSGSTSGVEKARTQPTVTASLSEMKPILTPVDIAAQPHRTHTNLSVVLRRTTPGKVTLRVLNPEGVQVVLLYDGVLQAGNWSFDWDGKLVGGGKPAPGRYKIQVESGAVTHEKNISIR